MSESLIEYTIIIEGEPIPKARHRTAHKDKNGNALPYVIFYDTQKEKKKAYREAAFQYLIKTGTAIFIIEGDPVSITCSFYMRRPKSHYGTGKNSEILKQNAPYYCTKKKDIDNLDKHVFDCLNGLCFKDDKQIVESHSKKIYSENPRTEIRIRSLGNDKGFK